MRTLSALWLFATLGLVAVLSLACSNEPFHATKAEGGDVQAYPLAAAMLKVWTRPMARHGVTGTDARGIPVWGEVQWGRASDRIVQGTTYQTCSLSIHARTERHSSCSQHYTFLHPVGSTAPSHAANGDQLIAITATAPFPDSAGPGRTALRFDLDEAKAAGP
jgi:hypothetical protein